MRGKRQPTLPGFERMGLKKFGGTLLRGNAREQRPISIKRPMHLVMRSSLAKGERSFLKKEAKIRGIIYATAYNKGVRIYRYANAGNHLHLIVKPESRQAFKRFIRAVSGLIARAVLGVERGRAQGIRFWDAKPFTRILEWGRDYKNACEYLMTNLLEAIGFQPYRPRARAPARP